MMLDALLILTGAIVWACWRRIIGGWFGAPRWACNVAGGIIVAAASLQLGAPWWLAGLFAAAMLWLPGHGTYQDMGLGWETDNEMMRPVLRVVFPARLHDTVAYDFAGMALLYTAMAAPVTALLSWWVGPVACWYLTTGPAVAAFYLAGSRVRGWGGLPGPALPAFGPVDGYTSMGEFVSGGLRGGAWVALMLMA